MLLDELLPIFNPLMRYLLPLIDDVFHSLEVGSLNRLGLAED